MLRAFTDSRRLRVFLFVRSPLVGVTPAWLLGLFELSVRGTGARMKRKEVRFIGRRTPLAAARRASRRHPSFASLPCGSLVALCWPGAFTILVTHEYYIQLCERKKEKKSVKGNFDESFVVIRLGTVVDRFTFFDHNPCFFVFFFCCSGRSSGAAEKRKQLHVLGTCPHFLRICPFAEC